MGSRSSLELVPSLPWNKSRAGFSSNSIYLFIFNWNNQPQHKYLHRYLHGTLNKVLSIIYLSVFVWTSGPIKETRPQEQKRSGNDSEKRYNDQWWRQPLLLRPGIRSCPPEELERYDVVPGLHDGIILLLPDVALTLLASPLGDAVHHLAGGPYPVTRSTQVLMLRDVALHRVLKFHRPPPPPRPLDVLLQRFLVVEAEGEDPRHHGDQQQEDSRPPRCHPPQIDANQVASSGHGPPFYLTIYSWDRSFSRYFTLYFFDLFS